MLTQKQIETYDKLFQISEKNMIYSGNQEQLSKESFLAVVGEPAFCVDIMKIATLPKEGFLQALYALAFRRLPEECMMELCKNNTDSDFEYKQMVTESVRHSIEFSNKYACIYNNMFSTHKNLPTITTYFAEYPMLNKIYGFYRRLPQGFRRSVRKVFGRKE